MKRLNYALGSCAALSLVLQSGVASSAMTPISSDPVVTESGKISGTRLASGIRAYLGIPFAAPPTGALRWAPPRPMQWAGIWNADRKGPECIQVLRPHDINHYFGEEPSSENCLYLNVWAPATATPRAKLPVIVYIYGGGYTIGSSGLANYDGENAAKAGAVFVNFNYRVGAFGFMAHPELTAEQGGHSGNYGIMDQIAALRWVRANIARFGGDPDKVLIMGQSAGAGSVVTQIFSPLSKGLFRAAVMSSGCNFGSNGLMGGDPDLTGAEQIGLQVQQSLGVKSLAAMRDIPADRVLATQSEAQVGAHVVGVRIGGPIVDGYVLPRPKSDLLAAGEVNRVPIIASYNGDDIDQGMNPLTRAKTVAAYRQAVADAYGPNADGFLKLYPVRTDQDLPAVVRAAASMSGLEGNARGCAIAETKLGQKAYLDNFVRKHPYVPGVTFADIDPVTVGAYHTADVPYWFNTLDQYNALRPTRAWTGYDRALSGKMLAALIAMAETGSPDTPAMPWPVWAPDAERKLVIGDAVSVQPLDVERLEWLRAHPAVVRPAPPAARKPRD